MTDNLLLPPFSRVLLAYQQERISLEFPIYIYVGKEAKDEAFAQKRFGTLCSFLPFNDDVIRYRWPIKDQKIVVYDTGSMPLVSLQKICLKLLTFEPRLVYLWSQIHPCQFFNLTRER
jgi:hypothetical protein